MVLSDKCCCCCKIHGGFFKIIYLDLARVLYGIFMLIFTFNNPMLTYVSQSFKLITFITITLQAFFAFFSYCKGVGTNNSLILFSYFVSKVLYTIANFNEKLIGPLIDCYSIYKNYIEEQGPDENILKLCDPNNQTVQLGIAIVWTLLEIYFVRVVYVFAKRVQSGYYGPIGNNAFRRVQRSLNNCQIVAIKGIECNQDIQYFEKGSIVKSSSELIKQYAFNDKRQKDACKKQMIQYNNVVFVVPYLDKQSTIELKQSNEQ